MDATCFVSNLPIVDNTTVYVVPMVQSPFRAASSYITGGHFQQELWRPIGLPVSARYVDDLVHIDDPFTPQFCATDAVLRGAGIYAELEHTFPRQRRLQHLMSSFDEGSPVEYQTKWPFANYTLKLGYGLCRADIYDAVATAAAEVKLNNETFGEWVNAQLHTLLQASRSRFIDLECEPLFERSVTAQSRLFQNYGAPTLWLHLVTELYFSELREQSSEWFDAIESAVAFYEGVALLQKLFVPATFVPSRASTHGKIMSRVHRVIASVANDMYVAALEEERDMLIAYNDDVEKLFNSGTT